MGIGRSGVLHERRTAALTDNGDHEANAENGDGLCARSLSELSARRRPSARRAGYVDDLQHRERSPGSPTPRLSSSVGIMCGARRFGCADPTRRQRDTGWSRSSASLEQLASTSDASTWLALFPRDRPTRSARCPAARPPSAPAPKGSPRRCPPLGRSAAAAGRRRHRDALLLRRSVIDFVRPLSIRRRPGRAP